MATNKIEKKNWLASFLKNPKLIILPLFMSFGVREYDSGVISLFWGQINPKMQDYILFVFISVTTSTTYPHKTISQKDMKCFHISKCFLCQWLLLETKFKWISLVLKEKLRAVEPPHFLLIFVLQIST